MCRFARSAGERPGGNVTTKAGSAKPLELLPQRETMPLNPAKGNMYGHITHTWNAIKGECPHQCGYCYMRRWGKQPPLHFDERELKTDLGSGNIVFIGSSCDMWADAIPVKWIEKTLEHCRKYPANKYIFQSKNPYRFLEFQGDFPECCALGTTIETDLATGVSCAPTTPTRSAGMFLSPAEERFVTIEPIMDFCLADMLWFIETARPNYVNIGADSGKNNLPEPPREKVLELIAELEALGIEVRQKPNLARIINKDRR
jgi:hypothetical protein